MLKRVMNFKDAIDLAMNGVKVQRYDRNVNGGYVYMYSQYFGDTNILYVKDCDGMELRLTDTDVFSCSWERS